jgi:putative DNA primase/helicase
VFHEKTAHAARGKWRGILLEFGLPESCLRDRHGECPLCGSKNFRWDNKDRNGTYICTCSAGTGFGLAIAFTGRGFTSVAAEIDRITGNLTMDTVQPRADLTDDERRKVLRATYSATQQMMAGDLADAYLASRNLSELVYPKSLRFSRALPDGEGGVRPCMVATIVDLDGKPVSLHRTFLKPDGTGKAEMAAPRKNMPGELPDGACVRLSDFTTGALGIAEGIETAMAASNLFTMPVWSALNAAMLAKWYPPAGCEEVAIFGDNDAKFGGQAAAYRLAHRIACRAAIPVTVHIPTVGDWADEWVKGA